MRTLQAFGPCDAYGDPKPDGVARIRLLYRTHNSQHGLVLDYMEACWLEEELRNAIRHIEDNRRAAVARSAFSEVKG